MANKQAIVLAVDQGHLMQEPFTDQMSRAQVAFECVNLTLQQKLFNNPSHEIGIGLFGDDEAEDGNNILLQPIGKPDLELVKNVQQLMMTEVKNRVPGGDIFWAVDYALDELNRHVGTKKFNKRVFLFTHGGGKSRYSEADIDKLQKKIVRSNVKLNIITIDFMEGYDPETNRVTVPDFSKSGAAKNIQDRNADLLMRLKDGANEWIQIFPASIAIELYRQFRKKDTTPVAQFRGTLEIAPGLGIDVATFKKVREYRPKGLKKYNLKEDWTASDKDGLVISDVVYHLDDDKNCEAIDSAELVNGYPYGKDIVPINKTMEAATKIIEEKCFKLLGFIGKEKVPRQCFMSNIDIVIPSDNLASKKLFSAFIYSMLSLNRYAIARYIPRNLKAGASPKLMLLIPHRNTKGECFYMTQLPTSEDIRDYQFSSLKESTERQQQLIAGLVEQMNLCQMTDDRGDTYEALKPKNTFNPYNQYLFQTIFHRAFKQSDETPPLDPQISDYLNIEKKIYKRTEPICRKLKEEFGVTVKEVKEKAGKKIIWKDLIKNSDVSTVADSEVKEEDMAVGAGKKFHFDEEDVVHVDSRDPVNSFRKMIANNHMDLVSRALSEMMEHIETRVKLAMAGERFEQVVLCLTELRIACTSQREEDAWDNWLARNLSTLPAQLVQQLKDKGLGYLKRSNADLYRPESKQLTVLKQELEMDDLD